jgi:molybdenum cofactor biosynthesis protein B
LKAHESHRGSAPTRLGFYVVTVSSSRFEKKTKGKKFADESGDVAERIIKDNKHLLAGRELVDDDKVMIVDALNDGLARGDVDVVVFTGGTGLSPRDVTVDAVRPLLEKEIMGFGEVMRAMSYAKIGSPAILSRTTAGLMSKRLVICLPGSPDGVETGLTLLMEDIPHIIYVARKNG